MSIRTPDDVKQLGTILFVAAHPDDETFNAGGLIAAAAQNGQTIIVVTATKGEGGLQDESRWPADKLGAIRGSELAEALKIIGCTHHYWLDYADGSCSTDSAAPGVRRISELIEQYKPQTILTFGPDGLTGHPDHKAVSAWADKANQGRAQTFHVVIEQDNYETYMKPAGEQGNWFFNIDKPPVKQAKDCDIALVLTPQLRDAKLKALRAMPSQYERFFQTTPPELLNHLFVTECFVRA